MVAQHGATAVYFAGLRALGYPPTWTTSGGETKRVKEYLKTY